MRHVERVWSYKVLVQQAAERHHGAKSRSEDRGNQMGADGEGHPKQARLQGQISRARVSRGTRGYIRTDAPTGSRDALLHDALSSSSRRLGTSTCSMLSQRISSQMASRDYCCCGCHTKKIRLLGRNQGECLLQLVRSTGREMLDVRGMSTASKCSRLLGVVESRVEQGLYYLHGPRWTRCCRVHACR